MWESRRDGKAALPGKAIDHALSSRNCLGGGIPRVRSDADWVIASRRADALRELPTGSSPAAVAEVADQSANWNPLFAEARGVYR